MADCAVGRFNDGEISVQMKESVRGKDVYVVMNSSYSFSLDPISLRSN